MSKTKALIKIVPIIGLIVIMAAIVFMGISVFLSLKILSDYYTDESIENQSQRIQKALLKEFDSHPTEPVDLMNELDPEFETSSPSDAFDVTETMKGFIDLYDLYSLKVLAILTGDDIKSIAVIKDPKSNLTQQYYEGDSIRGAIIDQILSKKVVVHWNKHVIELVLIERPKIKRIESFSEKRKRRLESLIITPEKTVQKKVARKTVKAFHSDKNFLKNAELTPIINGDKFEGVKISGVVPGSFLDVFGIQDDDVVIGLNGKKLFTKNAKSFLAYLSHMRDVTVEIKRDDVIHQLRYSYRDYPEKKDKNEENMVEDYP